MLVIPDYYDRPYVRDMIQLLLVRMGFKQLCVQQVIILSFLQGTPDETSLPGITGCYIWCGDI